MNRDVRPKARQIIQQTWQSQANLSVFLILLIIAVFVLPVVDKNARNYPLDADIVSTLLLATGVAIAWGRRRLFTIGVVVAVPTLVLRWLLLFVPSHTLRFYAEIAGVLSIVTVGYILLAQVFREGPINAVRVQGAVAAYLLMGVAYSHAYLISSYFNPAAITSTEGAMDSFVDWIYFSFATLSTLGYGDIIPTGQASRMLAIGEAISGQLFLAILIARLVSMQVSGPTSPSDGTSQ
jgi:hypothetical protein